MSNKPKYWKFKAYDTNLKVHAGIVSEDNPVTAIFKIRQTGLQVISIETASKNDYSAYVKTAVYRHTIIKKLTIIEKIINFLCGIRKFMFRS